MSIVCASLAFVFSAAPLSATPVAKLVQRAAGGQERLANGSLESTKAEAFEGWVGYGTGCRISRDVARGPGVSAVCDNPGGVNQGLSQTLTLNRSDVRPLIASAWSRARDVVGSPDANYSLYVDIIYQDGTPLWGRITPFSCGTHDWEYREVRIYPEKPVKSITVNALFRGRKGTAWFDDLSLKEAEAAPGMMLFEGAAVQLQNRGRAFGDAEIQVRDVITDSSFYICPAVGRTEVPELQVVIEARARQEHGGRVTDITVTDLARRDRAITLYYLLPIRHEGLRWCDNVRIAHPVTPSGSYQNTVWTGVGATGTTSKYPFACVAGPEAAWTLIVPRPRVCRLAYNAAAAEFYAAFDLALTQDSKTPGAATVHVYDARMPAGSGMRDASQRRYQLLPDYFDPGRIPARQGNWMAFQKISSLPSPEDFGFAVHEGDNDVRWDNDHGIAPYVYVEPMTWWRAMPPEMKRTDDTIMAIVEAARSDPKSPEHDIAWAVWQSATFDADGRHHVDLLDTPWCNGAVFGNSADPDVPEQDGHANLAHLNLRRLDDAMKKAEPHGGLAGVYLDSLEGWGMLKNYRREHFGAADLPLTFDSELHRPVILNAFSTQEWTEHIYRQMRKRGKTLMANAVPYNFPYLALPLDLMGTETNWQRDGQFAPPSPDEMYLRRTLAWRKPYMFLMNTHYETWTAAMTERYMQICLFYGMFPGFFSENAATNCYFANPTWYERDRPLFRRYMPLIRRVAEAGWEPLTRASCEPGDVWLERWGSGGDKPFYLTVMNTADAVRRTTIALDPELLQSRSAQSLITTRPFSSDSALTLDLAPHAVEVIEVK